MRLSPEHIRVQRDVFVRKRNRLSAPKEASLRCDTFCPARKYPKSRRGPSVWSPHSPDGQRGKRIGSTSFKTSAVSPFGIPSFPYDPVGAIMDCPQPSVSCKYSYTDVGAAIIELVDSQRSATRSHNFVNKIASPKAIIIRFSAEDPAIAAQLLDGRHNGRPYGVVRKLFDKYPFTHRILSQVAGFPLLARRGNCVILSPNKKGVGICRRPNISASV